MGREIQERFQPTQVWIRDPSNDDVAQENKRRAQALLGLNSLAIPIHALVTPENELLATYTYSPAGTSEEYVDWLRATRAAWEGSRK